MTASGEQQERLIGWVLGAALALHLQLIGGNAGAEASVWVILVLGAVLRWRMVFIPNWLGRLAILIGFAAVITSQQGFRPSVVLGELAGLVGALLLLRPVNSRRGLQVILCLLVMLTTGILNPSSNLGVIFVIGDAIAFLFLAEQIHRPPEAAESFWVSVVRAFRIVVPVGAVVSGLFWIFPRLSDYTPAALTGFSVDGILNPGAIAELSASRRVALVARFGEGQRVPSAGDLYWRGRVLETNDGLVWSLAAKRVERERLLGEVRPGDLAGSVSYVQDLTSTRGGIVPVLDHAVFVDAVRDGTSVAVLDIGAGVLSAVGSGPLTMEVVSSLDEPSDQPVSAISKGSLDLPSTVVSSRAILEIREEVFRASSTVSEKRDAVARFFRDADFVYTTRPGRVRNLEQFLTIQRQGFCEHYAAAAANLLRLAGVPARVVTGYRGGEWNPWLRTITVRDSNAHAWVEVWDDGLWHWSRFDPTDAVDATIAGRIEREMDASQWSIFRTVWSYVGAFTTLANEWISGTWARVTSSDVWEHFQTALFAILFLAGLFWMVRQLRSARATGVPETAARLLLELESRAATCGRARNPGETPLAWLHRIERTSDFHEEREHLRSFAASYEAGMYRRPDAESQIVGDLMAHSTRLRSIWRRRRLSAD